MVYLLWHLYVLHTVVLTLCVTPGGRPFKLGLQLRMINLFFQE